MFLEFGKYKNGKKSALVLKNKSVGCKLTWRMESSFSYFPRKWTAIGSNLMSSSDWREMDCHSESAFQSTGVFVSTLILHPFSLRTCMMFRQTLEEPPF